MNKILTLLLAPLGLMAMVEVTQENYQTDVLNSKSPVVLEVYSTHCSRCKQMKPILTELEEEFGNKVKFAKINVDKEYTISVSLGIQAVPTTILIKKGQVVQKEIGTMDKEALKELIQKNL